MDQELDRQIRQELPMLSRTDMIYRTILADHVDNATSGYHAASLHEMKEL